MSRYCTVCSHQERQTIDVLLLRHAASYRRIATRFGLREASVRRHQERHLQLSLALSKELSAMLSAENLLTKLAELDDATRAMLAEAQEAGDLRVALQAVHESRATIETFSRLGVLSDLEKRLAAVEAEQEHH